eukprot:16334594-Heterocapsa_arctica.AAC.1
MRLSRMGDSLKAFIAQQAPVSDMEAVEGLGSLDRESSGSIANHSRCDGLQLFSVEVARQQVSVE